MMRFVVAVGLVVSALSVPLNTLAGSSGATELTSIAEVRFPDWFGGVTFGGAITAEALVTATARGLSIATLVVAAAAFNAAVDHYRLVRLAPRSLAPAMLIVTIAIQVVPQAVDHARRVAEVRRLRGRAGRGLRALPALLLPVLEGALERSVQRAESLEARGLGGGGASSVDQRRSLAGVVGIGLCAGGAFALYYYGGGLLPAALFASGVALVLTTQHRRGPPMTPRLRGLRMTTRDVGLLAAVTLAVALVLTLRSLDSGGMTYIAYPEVHAPAFTAVGALASLLFVAPAFLAGGSDA
jgi:energy-coupling factor transport system permease protein